MLYSNGGGVFFVPFFICIVLVVFPIYYVEAAYGHLYRRTLHTYFDVIDSRFIGVSFAVATIVFFMSVYYNCLLAWSCNFFLFAFQKELPWAIHENDELGTGVFWNEGYFKEDFLHISGDLLTIDEYVPWIIVSFLIVTILTYITIFKSLESAGIAVYIIIPLAYVILFVLFVKGQFLEGKTIGWTFLFTPDWSKLYTLKIWRDAISQVIFSAGLGMHAVILFGSHKSKDEKILLPAVCIPILNFMTSIFAAITLFSCIGHASYKTGISIQNMPIDGLELAFVAYPALLSTFPLPQLWTALFFLMLILVGLSTQYALIDVACTFIEGIFFRFHFINISKQWLEAGLLTIVFVIDIGLFGSNAGYYWVDFIDHYVVGVNLVICILFQVLILGHYLPLENMSDRVEAHNETMPSYYKF